MTNKNQFARDVQTSLSLILFQSRSHKHLLPHLPCIREGDTQIKINPSLFIEHLLLSNLSLGAKQKCRA